MKNTTRYLTSTMALAPLLVGVLGAGTTASAADLRHAVQTNIPGVYAFTQPPADFDPRVASDADLAAWGLPPRPAAEAGADALAHWVRAVTAPLKRVVPQLKMRPGVSHRAAEDVRIVSRSPNGKLVAATSPNWSGVVLVPGAGQKKFAKVEASYVIPTVHQAPSSPCNETWDYSSEWVGLGGYADNYLFQSGVSADAYCDIPGSTVVEYSPWIEWLPADDYVLYENASTNTLYPMQPGDVVLVEVWATAFSTAGVSKTGNLIFDDVTQGWSISLTESAASLGGSEVTGNSAEWIVERTTVNKALAVLPDYTADAWVDTAAYDTGNVEYLPGSPLTATVYSVTMLDNSKKAESFADIFGTNALWFFPEGSANH